MHAICDGPTRRVMRCTVVKDDGLIRPLSSSIRPRFYPCTGLHLPHPLSARTQPAAAGALLMSVDSVHIHSCIVA